MIHWHEKLNLQISSKKIQEKADQHYSVAIKKKVDDDNKKKNLTIISSKWLEWNGNLCKMFYETQLKYSIRFSYQKSYLSNTGIHDDQNQKLRSYFSDLVTHKIQCILTIFQTHVDPNQWMFLTHYMISNFPMNVLNGCHVQVNNISFLQNRRVLSTATEAPTLLFRNLWHYKIICIRIIDESFRPRKLHFVPLRVNSVSLQRRTLFTYFVYAFRDGCVNESNLNHRMWSIYLGCQSNLIWYLFRSLMTQRSFNHLLLSDRFLVIPSSSKSFCLFEHDVIIFFNENLKIHLNVYCNSVKYFLYMERFDKRNISHFWLWKEMYILV